MENVERINDFLLKSPDLYIRKYEYDGTATLNNATPAAALLTPAAAPDWTEDAYNSAVSENLYVVDDDGDVCAAKIADTADSYIVFDATALKKMSDGATTAALTNGSEYRFQILSPHNVYQYGNFIGYIGDGLFEDSQKKVSFKCGIPRRMIPEDIVECGTKLTAKLFSTEAKLTKAIRNMSKFGSQTDAYRFSKGFSPDASDFYQITMVAETADGRLCAITLLRGQFSISCAESVYSDEYKSVSFEYAQVPNMMFPEHANMYIYIDKIL